MSAHVSLRTVSKRYGATEALRDVTMSVTEGTVHALIGENGAGKSTLGKVIGGVVQPDRGQLIVDGRATEFSSPRDALRAGVTTIAQELALVPTMTVLDNIFLGQEPARKGFVARAALRRRYDQLVSEHGLAIDPDALVRDLALAEQQKVEVLRALARDARLLILDEPTAALSAGDTQRLLQVTRQIAERGRTVIFVSHFLHEVMDVADEVTVLRDGKVVSSGAAKNETHDSLVMKMIGRELEATFPKAGPPGSRKVVEAHDLHAAGVGPVSLDIRAGEIVGVAGLVGSGRTELTEAIFGARKRIGGTVLVNGVPFDPKHPADALRSGIGHISEDRKVSGLILNRPVRENLMNPRLDRVCTGPWIHADRERELTRSLIDQAGIKTSSPEALAVSLSGGNQQKILIARWIHDPPFVILADEPTRGVDIGAKREIYQLLVLLADSGVGVLFVSSDMEELLGLSHRVLVMKEGRIVEELAGARISEEEILRAATGASKRRESSE